MKRVDYLFTRSGQVIMTGACSIDVENPNDEEEVKAALDALEFKEFLPLSIDWLKEEWTFEPAPTRDTSS